MPARDIYHPHVIQALEADGWTITHDPFRIHWGGRDVYVDLGAELLVGAERQGHTIAVEIKSFLGPSMVADLEQALGQFVLYHDLLARTDPTRVLFLAVHEPLYQSLFTEPIGALLLENDRVRLLVFDPHTKEIVRWIPSRSGDAL